MQPQAQPQAQPQLCCENYFLCCWSRRPAGRRLASPGRASSAGVWSAARQGYDSRAGL